MTGKKYNEIIREKISNFDDSTPNSRLYIVDKTKSTPHNIFNPLLLDDVRFRVEVHAFFEGMIEDVIRVWAKLGNNALLIKPEDIKSISIEGDILKVSFSFENTDYYIVANECADVNNFYED